MGQDKGYNERLFSGRGLRSYFHTARYRWFQELLRSMNCSPRKIVEIGCFDGKLLDYLAVEPEYYVGIDAGWEGGLDLAVERYKGKENYRFVKASDPGCFDTLADDCYDIGVAMETLEHVPPEMVDGYLKKLSEVVSGYVFITVPNEKGVVFLAKWLVKKVFYGGAEKYSLAELFSAVMGYMDKVERIEHKGFDYACLIKDVRKYFDVVRVDSIPVGVVPVSLSFNVGILARSRKEQT